MQPRPESRVESLEKRASTIEATLIELSSDTAEELKVIRLEVGQLNDGMIASFKQIGEIFDRNFERFDAVEVRLDRIESAQTEQGKKLDQLLQLVQKELGG
jgi:uncharacterized coiled-coil protein SlyX